MGTARAAAERRWTSRIGWAATIVGITLYATVTVLGPLDRPLEAILVAILAGLLGFILGKEAGYRQRRFLPFRGSGPRLREYMTGSEVPIYESCDTMEYRFELTKPDVHNLLLLSVTTAPFIGSAVAKALDLPAGVRGWEASWLLQTHDSAGRPIFLDQGSILGMLEFTRAHKDNAEVCRALQCLRQIRQAATLDDDGRASLDAPC